jgi:plastocyanin
MRTTSLLFLLLLSIFACSSKKSADTGHSSPAARSLKIDPRTVATVSGVVKLEGAPPKPQKIDMGQDPACGNQPNFDESFVVNNGDLANVFVYVKSVAPGAGGGIVTAATTPPIEQKDCRYHPHVMGVLVGQRVTIVNHDETTHNIHPVPAQNRQWNESQMPKDPPLEKTFNQPEIMIPVKCNQHPWMKMYLNVVGNPWFAVTDENGKFEIKDLPPGDYTLAAVHEKLGEQEMKISVGPRESRSANFTFKAP